MENFRFEISEGKERAKQNHPVLSHYRLFIPQRLNRVEARCFPGGIITKDESDSY